jgi:hypothetical protein
MIASVPESGHAGNRFQDRGEFVGVSRLFLMTSVNLKKRDASFDSHLPPRHFAPVRKSG